MALHGDVGQKEKGREGEFLGAFVFGASSLSAMTRSKCAEVEKQPDGGVESGRHCQESQVEVWPPPACLWASRQDACARLMWGNSLGEADLNSKGIRRPS